MPTQEKPFPGTTKTQADIEKTIHSLIFDVALEAALAEAIILVPFLGFPIIKQIFYFIARNLMELVYKQLALATIFTMIDIDVENQRLTYEAARTALKKELSKPEDLKNETERQAAVEEFRRKLRDLIKFPKPV